MLADGPRTHQPLKIAPPTVDYDGTQGNYPSQGIRISPPSLTSHPRTISWLGTSALAMGGSNQMVFLVAALIAVNGSGAIPVLIVGLLLSWMAAPGWTELVLMWPGRVGGIAATCAEAFKPYSPVLANLTASATGGAGSRPAASRRSCRRRRCTSGTCRSSRSRRWRSASS